MKKIFGLRAAMLGIGLSIGAIAPAQAQLVAVVPAFSCNNASAMTVMNPDAIACSGAWDGNNSNQQTAVLNQIQADFAFWTGASSTWSFIGTSTGATANPTFASAGTGATGSLVFANPVYGYFALSLKAANQFSVYLFNAGTAGLSQIDYYSTIGSSLNNQQVPQALSHASLYAVGDPFTPDVVPTPEPASIVLMMTGLGAVALVRRRRRQV